MTDDRESKGKSDAGGTQIRKHQDAGRTMMRGAPVAQTGRAMTPREEMLNDPAMAKYRALMVREDDKKVLERSLLFSLVVFTIAIFIVFPEVIGALQENDKKEDSIEIPKQTIVKVEKKEKKQEKKIKEEIKQRKFNQLPDIARPSGADLIIEDIDKLKLEVFDEDVDDYLFGDIPLNAPGPVEVAGDIIAPQIIKRGPQPYPQRAKILRRSGEAKVRLIVRKDGSFEILEVVSESPKNFEFGKTAVKYIETFKFKPALQNGRPLDVFYNLIVQFNLKN